MKNKMRDAISIILATTLLSQCPVWALPEASTFLRPNSAIERNVNILNREGFSRLEQLRTNFSNLPPYLLSTARIWSVMDLLLDRPQPPIELEQYKEALNEYTATREYLLEHYPDFNTATSGPISLKVAADTIDGSSIITFEVRTSKDRYLFAIQTQNIESQDYLGSRVRCPDVADQDYRLEEIVTGVCYPWEPPGYYPASFIRGETDRFGNPLGEDGQKAWRLKPGFYHRGFSRGDFQFFKLIPASADIPAKWGELAVEPTPGSPGTLKQLRLNSETEDHHLVRNSADSVMADIVTGRLNRGQGLIVAFANGNSGFGLVDRSTASPYRISNIQTITRGTRGQRGVRFNLTSSYSQASLNPATDVILDTLRGIREWSTLTDVQDWERLQKLEEFAHVVHDLPAEVHTALRREGISLYEMLLRTRPVIRIQSDAQYHHLYILKYTVDGHIYLVEMKLPASYKIERGKEGSIVIDSKGSSISCEVSVTTDFPALHLLDRNELFTPQVLEFARANPGFDQKLTETEFLASQEFFSAGSYRFLQYFSRDTLIWLLLSESMLTQRAHEAALQGIFNRVSADGELPSVEEVYGQVEFELIAEFCQEARSARLSPPSGDVYKGVKAVARSLNELKAGSVQRCKYGVPDVSLMLLPAMLDYIRRPDIPSSSKVSFLRSQGNQGVSNLLALLRNLDLVTREADTYVEQRRKNKQLGLPEWHRGLLDANTEDYANWRDILKHGRYPTDVNVELMPIALESARDIVGQLLSMPLSDDERQLLEARATRLNLSKRLQTSLTTWRSVKDKCLFRLNPPEIRDRLKNYLSSDAVSSQERQWFLQQRIGTDVVLGEFMLSEECNPPILQVEVPFFPVALNEDGTPVPVVASDGIFGLLDNEIDPARLLETLTPLFLPYPLGLWTPAGLLATSPALSNDHALWKEITKNTYGGSVVYGWQMEYLKKGLIKQLLRFAQLPPNQQDKQLMEIIYSALKACCGVKLPEGASESNHELRSWFIAADGFHSRSFRDGNLVQLWSISSNEMLLSQVDSIAAQLGLNLLRHDETNGGLLDAIAEARRRYPVTPVPDLIESAALPRVAVVTHSLGAGGGSNIVAWDQITTGCRLFGYPVTVLTGQFLRRQYEEETAEEALRRMGVQYFTEPKLDIRSDVEDKAWAGQLREDDPEFRKEVGDLQGWLEQKISDVDVVLIHQIMTMPSNPVATVAFANLAKKYYGKKRFVVWVHNSLRGQITSWPFSLITTMNPCMEYVAVSPQQRDLTADLFKVDPSFISSINNSRSALTFAQISQKALEFFIEHDLYNADSLWFYPARMEESKFIEVAIHAVDEARREGKNVKLIIATPAINGHLPTQGREHDYLERLTRLRDSLNLTDNVIFYPHQGPEDEIWSLYNLTDVLTFTTQVETFGIPIVEAGLAGVIIARTDLPELARLIPPDMNHIVIGKFHAHHPKDSPGYFQDIANYGAYLGRQLITYLRENPAFVRTRQYKRHVLRVLCSEAVFSGAVSHILNVPPPGKRQLHSGGRNYRGEFVEAAMRDVANAQFSSFEINFEDFRPSDIKEDGRQKIRDAKKDLILNVRLTDFPNWDSETARNELREAAKLAFDVGAENITVCLGELTDVTSAMILEAADWAREEAQRRGIAIPSPLFSVENIASRKGVIGINELNQVFEGKPVGVSIWMDSIVDNPIQYVEQLRMKVQTVYLGEDFLTRSPWNHMENAANLLRWMREHNWQGTMINHGHTGTREMRRLVADQIISMAYILPLVCRSLHIGDILTPPSLTPAPLIRNIETLPDTTALAYI